MVCWYAAPMDATPKRGKVPQPLCCNIERPHLLGAFLSGIYIHSAYAFYTTFIGAGHG